MKRYPVQPLLDLTGLTLNGFIRLHMPSVNGGAYRKIRTEGLTADQADRWAVKVGMVAYDVWPELLDDQIEGEKVPCEECGEGFIPTRKGHRFCSPACVRRRNDRESKRRRYQSDPEFRAKERERNRRYIQEARRAVTIQQRQYKRDNADRIREKQREYYHRNREAILERQRAYYRNRREDAA